MKKIFQIKINIAWVAVFSFFFGANLLIVLLRKKLETLDDKVMNLKFHHAYLDARINEKIAVFDNEQA